MSEVKNTNALKNLGLKKSLYWIVKKLKFTGNFFAFYCLPTFFLKINLFSPILFK